MESIKETQQSDALQAARDTSTPAPVLETLYLDARRHYDNATRKMHEENPDVMAALAQNPNMPPRFLRLLLSGYPEAFCQNPVVPFLPLEVPTFWAEAREEDVLHLLRLPDVPAMVVQTLAANGAKPAVQKAARLHVGVAGELGSAPWQQAVREACRAEALPATERIEQLFADWVEVGLLPRTWCENQLPEPVPAYEPKLNNLRPSFLSAQDKLAALAPDATPEQLHALTEGRDLRDSSVTIAVALHPNTSAETLRHLGRRRQQNLGLAVAFHPNTPPDALRYFAEGTYQGDRVRKLVVARHANADAELLRVLAADQDPVVRRLARRHPNAPDDLMAISRQAALTVGKTEPHVKNAAQLWFIFHALHAKPTLGWLTQSTRSNQWMKRLAAGLAFVRRASEKAASAKPGKPIKWSNNEQALRAALQNDGNRLVRAVANAPITPVFDFVL